MLYQQVKLEKEKQKFSHRNLRKGYGWMYTGMLEGNVSSSIGVDPGVNFGITIINMDKVTILNGALLQQTQKIRYAQLAHELMSDLINLNPQEDPTFVVEGAAYNKTFGQVGLAEVRTGFYLALEYQYNMVWTPPPASVRVDVFGSGKVQAGDIWPTLNHNAADSLSIALYRMR